MDSFMVEKSELISPLQTKQTEPDRRCELSSARPARTLTEIALVFGLILSAIWTPQGQLNRSISIVAALCVVGLAITGDWTPSELGLTRPRRGAAAILLTGAILCGTILLVGTALRFAGAGNALPWSRSWQCVLWALEQEFILQSIFFVRLASVFGARRGVILAAALFSIAHLPSPVLTLLSFVGGIVFSDLFRRFRNLYALGVIHGALGLTIAASMPDTWLHHMRVGLGYLTSHP
jgi:hypothetical protein